MGQPKQLLRIDGQTLVRRAASAAIDAGCEPVIVVTGSSSELIVQELNDLPVTPIFHPGWSAGVGSSLRAGLSALLSEAPNLTAVVILVCDQPHMSAEIVQRLIQAWRHGKKSMAACKYGGTFGPPCCFGSELFSDLGSLYDEQGAKRLLSAHPESLTLLAWPEGAEDWDFPGDIKP
jgi:molybdenum cofactor cytidylyltransferase